jgi:hypothetical protein
MACGGRSGTEGSASNRAEARLRSDSGAWLLSGLSMPTLGRALWRVVDSVAARFVSQTMPPASALGVEFSWNRAWLNRQTRELKRLVTHGKQTAAISSNRQKIQFRKTDNAITSAILSAAESSPDRDPEFSLNALEGTDIRGVLQFLTNRFWLTSRMRCNSFKTNERTISNRGRNRILRSDCRSDATSPQDHKSTTSGSSRTSSSPPSYQRLDAEKIHREVFDFQSRPQHNAPSVPLPHKCVRKEKNRYAKIFGVSVSSCAWLVR